MAERHDEKRVRKVASMVWEVLGTFEKTSTGPRSVGRQRRYQIAQPLAPAPGAWPELDDERLSVIWNGCLCEFTPGQGNQYTFLRLLVQAKGRWVSYATIEDDCLSGEMVSSAAIRQFKRRLVKTLEAAGMGELAAAISAKNEAVRLNL